MKILEKRPLALILCIMLGGFSFSLDFSIKVKLILAGICLASISVMLIFQVLKRSRIVICLISLLALLISVLLSALWSYTFFPTQYYGQNVSLEARIYDIDNSGSTTSVLICKTNKIEAKKDKHTFITYIDKADAVKVKKYDVISFDASLSELKSYDDGFDGRSYYVSKGFSALLTNVTNLEVKENKIDRFDSFFKSLRLKISNCLKMRTNFETGSFLSALIVGDRNDLNGNTRLNFARLGISHILALSGMHLAILSIALNSILTRVGIRKKIRVALMGCLILFYIALTGFSASVLRSGFMLIITSVLFLLERKADALTSLVISVSIIVACNPTSVFDMSLWLSAFATLGVVVYAEIAEKPEKNTPFLKKCWISLKNGALVSVFACAATFAFTAIRFNSFSVITVFTTLIFSFVIQFFIYGGLLLLLLGRIIPFGKLLVFFSDLILGLAEFISTFKFVYVSMHSAAVKILVVIMTVFFFAFLVLEFKNKKRGIAILLVLMLTTFAVAECDTVVHRYDDGVDYIPSASGDMSLIKSCADVSVVYSGKAFADEGWSILDTFYNERLTYIDNFIFTSYSYSAIDFTDTIISGIKVEKVLLPRPTTSDEIAQAEGLAYLFEGYGTDMEFYDIVDYMELGEYKFRLIEKVDYTYGKYPKNMYEIVLRDERFIYLSACEYGTLSPSAKAFLYNSKILIIGSIGNSKYYLFDMRLPDLREIYYYDLGRLTEDAEEYYKEKGVPTHCIKTPIELLN